MTARVSEAELARCLDFAAAFGSASCSTRFPPASSAPSLFLNQKGFDPAHLPPPLAKVLASELSLFSPPPAAKPKRFPKMVIDLRSIQDEPDFKAIQSSARSNPTSVLSARTSSQSDRFSRISAVPASYVPPPFPLSADRGLPPRPPQRPLNLPKTLLSFNPAPLPFPFPSSRKPLFVSPAPSEFNLYSKPAQKDPKGPSSQVSKPSQNDPKVPLFSSQLPIGVQRDSKGSGSCKTAPTPAQKDPGVSAPSYRPLFSFGAGPGSDSIDLEDTIQQVSLLNKSKRDHFFQQNSPAKSLYPSLSLLFKPKPKRDPETDHLSSTNQSSKEKSDTFGSVRNGKLRPFL